MKNQDTEYTPWKFRQSLRGMKLTAAQYRVAIELAEHSRNGNAAVWPSISTLASHCATTTRTVERALKQLADLGILTKGEGKSTRILVIQKPTPTSVTSDAGVGHTPTPTSDEYLKYENKEPSTNSEATLGSREVGMLTCTDRGSVPNGGSTDGVEKSAFHSGASASMERMKKSASREVDLCIECGCDMNDPEDIHAPQCPDNPSNLGTPYSQLCSASAHSTARPTLGPYSNPTKPWHSARA